jgi:hypothetical protein
MVDPQDSRTRERAITFLAVLFSVLLVGHVTALAPDSPANGWFSAAAFTCLVFAYATLTESGRRSGASAFAAGAIAVVPLWFASLVAVSNLGMDNWYFSNFSGFRVGLSDRGFGHAGEVWIILWVGSLLCMIGLALGARRLMPAGHSRRRDMSKTAASTTPKDGLITFCAIYALLTAAGNLAVHLSMWGPARPASLVLFAALVGLYAFFTGPGRRTGWRAYLLYGALLPGVLWVMAVIGYVLPLSYEGYTVYEALIAGFVVKFEVTGAYAPFPLSEILWLLEMVLAVGAGPILRELGRREAVRELRRRDKRDRPDDFG